MRLAALAVNMTVWWFAWHWAVRRFGIEPQAAQTGCVLALMLIELPLENRLNAARSRRLQPRQAWFSDERSDRRARWLRPISLVFLAMMLLVQLDALRRYPHDLGLASHLQLAATALVVLTMWRANLIQDTGNATVDEAGRAEILHAARHGFAALVVFCFAALISGSVWAGTLSASLPAALIAAIMVTQVSLMIQQRRGLRRQDD